MRAGIRKNGEPTIPQAEKEIGGCKLDGRSRLDATIRYVFPPSCVVFVRVLVAKARYFDTRKFAVADERMNKYNEIDVITFTGWWSHFQQVRSFFVTISCLNLI